MPNTALRQACVRTLGTGKKKDKEKWMKSLLGNIRWPKRPIRARGLANHFSRFANVSGKTDVDRTGHPTTALRNVARAGTKGLLQHALQINEVPSVTEFQRQTFPKGASDSTRNSSKSFLNLVLKNAIDAMELVVALTHDTLGGSTKTEL